MNPIFYIDFYKVGHIAQYPQGITQVWSNWTPRSTRVPGRTHVVFFGLNYFIKKYLIAEFSNNFFARPEAYIINEYRDVIRETLNVVDPPVEHIRALHRLGYLPIEIFAIPEGFSTPLGVPPMILSNTMPDFFWLPNYLETLLSNVLWKPSTSATTAQDFRKLFFRHAKQSGETDFSFIDWQGHDFSMRGMSGIEDAILSGMGHLLSFSGTDTLPAILAAVKYYGAKLNCGGSVPATEHSVMCAGGKEDEFETFRRLIEDVYPSGVVSVVSDTWDLWKVLTDFVPRLKDKILARDGKLVIRPDSGDPVKIICGDSSRKYDDHAYKNPTLPGKQLFHPAYFGVLDLLSTELGVVTRQSGLPLINKAGAIYGDAINLERADQILTKTINLGLSPYNMVFGIGSFTYEYVTRDTNGYAMKNTAVRKDGKIIPIFKKPITDDGGKASLYGLPAVYRTELSTDDNPDYFVVQEATEDQLHNCALERVFKDSTLLINPTFEEVRKRARAWQTQC